MKKTILKLLLVALVGSISSCEVDRDIESNEEITAQIESKQSLSKNTLQTIYRMSFVSDFDQTITGPRYADTYRPVTYKTSVTSSAYTYHWEYKNKTSNSWRNVPNGITPSVTFKISTSVAYNPFNGIEVRCTITKPNGDKSRKTIITQVEGRGGPRP